MSQAEMLALMLASVPPAYAGKAPRYMKGSGASFSKPKRRYDREQRRKKNRDARRSRARNRA